MDNLKKQLKTNFNININDCNYFYFGFNNIKVKHKNIEYVYSLKHDHITKIINLTIHNYK